MKKSFLHPPEKKTQNNNGPKILYALLFLLVIAAILIYVLNKKNDKSELTEAVMDSSTVVVDSIIPRQTDSLTVITPSPADSSTFKIVVTEYSTQDAAEKALARFTGFGHKLEILNVDSNKYRLAMRLYQPMADTSTVKDSLSRLFGTNTFVQP